MGLRAWRTVTPSHLIMFYLTPLSGDQGGENFGHIEARRPPLHFRGSEAPLLRWRKRREKAGTALFFTFC